jgi:hypothetical protein
VEAQTDAEGCEELLKGFLQARKASLAKENSGDASSISIPLYPASAGPGQQEPLAADRLKHDLPG